MSTSTALRQRPSSSRSPKGQAQAGRGGGGGSSGNGSRGGEGQVKGTAAARRVRVGAAKKGGAATATVALLVAAALATVSVALATRSLWSGSGSGGAKMEPPRKRGWPGAGAPGAAPVPAKPGEKGAGASSGAAGDPAGAGASPPPVPMSDPQAGGAASGTALKLPEDQAVSPERRVYLFEGGKALVVRDDDARLAAYSIIDLSDDWVPFLFRERTPGRDDFRKNDYRQTFVNLANDRTDEEGKPLKEGEHNYVELFGIPPSLSVVRRRFLDDEARACYKALQPGVLRGYRGAVKYEGGTSATAVRDRFKELKGEARKAMRRTGAQGVDGLKRRGNAFLAKQYRLYQTKLGVIYQAQLRLACEGLYGPGEKMRRMVFDYNMHQALARFERKHMLYGWGQLYGKTLRTLSRPALENNYATFRRVIRERVVHSLGIIEDGTAPPEEGAGKAAGAGGDASVGEGKGASKGKARARRSKRGGARRGTDLVHPFTQKVLEAMDLDTPAKVLAFFHQQPPELFRRFRVGVKLPPLPDYYGTDMVFEVVIDRGDVWYDPPFTASGKLRTFPRSRQPSLTLFAVQGERRIPLARYPTTVGGWRTEYHDGKEYYAYKGSDVGPRIWRDVVAGPVWIPPPTTPPKSLLTYERKGGKWIRRVNREEIGPSYASAYGLVAAYHIEESRAGRRVAWKDNGIRTHGSVDYMSILTRYSHGCHRLHNHLAVRLFSYVLRHSHFVRRGQVPLAYAKRFTAKGQSFTVRIDTRGYYYTLRKPVRVMVTEGRILGKQKTPIDHYVAIPGKTYDPDDPNLKPSAKVESEAKDSKDGYKPTGDLPPEKAAPEGGTGAGAGESFLRRLDPRTLPPPPMQP